ncbi:MAG: serine/threonine protein kinase [Bacteroidales bacterium]|jgi:serine/threonine protein kinase|nr:serine/threonine protein kinase [Bacteroidales bacterium]
MMQLQENAMFGEHDRYRLIRLLGHGGYSEVWLAEDMQAGLNVALKVYAPGRGLNEDGVTQFSKEFKMVFNLNHPNLLRPTHYDVFERMPYLIMPFCEHGSSSKISGKIDEHMAWTFLLDVASGLSYLHGQNPPVIHQDIKPDNVLMDSASSFVITDFGISAKVRNTLQTAGSKAGTMTYMAPERFNTDYQPVKASDVWALGASLFELMTGKPPFGENGGLAQKGGAELVLPKGWSPKLKQLILNCLKPKPWDRPTAKAIAEEAKQYFEIPMDTLPDTPVRKFPVKWVLALVAMLILGLCAGFITGSRMGDQPNPKLDECISLIEQGDAGFNENDLKTWRETLVKYQEAQALIENNSLRLPNMDYRIKQLKEEMDHVIDISIENAKKAFAARSEMALVVLNDALVLDPDHKEAKALYEQYSKFFNNKNN